MIKYKEIRKPYHEQLSVWDLNELGKDEWRLINVIDEQHDRVYIFTKDVSTR